jgi:hypothetical protein
VQSGKALCSDVIPKPAFSPAGREFAPSEAEGISRVIFRTEFAWSIVLLTGFVHVQRLSFSPAWLLPLRYDQNYLNSRTCERQHLPKTLSSTCYSLAVPVHAVTNTPGAFATLSRVRWIGNEYCVLPITIEWFRRCIANCRGSHTWFPSSTSMRSEFVTRTMRARRCGLQRNSFA